MNNIQFRKKINEIIKKLSKFREVEAIYLFGSVARGNTHKLSDIDICVIEKKGAEIIYFEEGFDIVSFWNMPLAIRFRIFKEGKALFVRDKMYIDRVKINTLREYLDFKPLIDRYCWERFGCTT